MENIFTGNHLTKTERNILSFISKGMTSQQIADTLFVAKGTVDKHRKNMLKKLGAKNTVQLLSATHTW